jgi:hypothetical protein
MNDGHPAELTGSPTLVHCAMMRVSVTGNCVSSYTSVNVSLELCAMMNMSLYGALVHIGMFTTMESPTQGSVLGGLGIVHMSVIGSVVPVVMTVGPVGKGFALHAKGLVYCPRTRAVSAPHTKPSASERRRARIAC